MARSINKVAKRLALKQLAGKDIRSKIKSEAEFNSWGEGKLKRLITIHVQIEEGKRWRKE
ncbi:hypothetical protein [Bacillus cereus]|uniref:Uncharacterized protein n=1 Tax=Bacillus cereus VD184 TaxID=1053242 RepID=A0A9W5R087_BACCE|nr:hypothetical protein [Bacillus cereus]EOQ01006.1 hypothetical protein IKC_06204 [Bacillus cereus VD184]